MSEYEEVDHPEHYNKHPAGIECIDVVEHMSFNIGSAVKYLWRTGLKPDVDQFSDLDKAIWYIQREKERLGGTVDDLIQQIPGLEDVVEVRGS